MLAKAVLGLVAAAVVLLVVLYAIHPASKQPPNGVSVHADTAATFAAATRFAPVTPLTPVPPTPSPDRSARIVDGTTHGVGSAPLPGSFEVYSPLTGGRLLLRGGEGQAEIQNVAGDKTMPLPAPRYSVFDVSLDGRYVVWLDAGRLHGYDVDSPAEAQSPNEPLAAIPPAHFPDQLSDGGLLLCTNDACTMTVIVEPSGRAGETLPSGAAAETLDARADAIVPSPDGRQLAWAVGGVVDVYNRDTGSRRVYDQSLPFDSELAWSPDGREIAYVHVLEDNDVRVAVLDVASGTAHDVYTAPGALRFRDIGFADVHTLRFELPPLELYRFGSEPLPGATYEVADDGSGGHALGDLQHPWALCGPACGLPPTGEEDTHGLAWWCEVYGPHDECRFHLDIVDRAASTTREVLAFDEAEAMPSQAKLSPDGRQIAVVTTGPDGRASLHLVPLASGARPSEIALGYSNVPGITWLPDSSAVMLYAILNN